MFKILKKSIRTGVVTTRYPKEKEGAPEGFVGDPVWYPDKCTGCGACVIECPSSAIAMPEIEGEFSWRLDLGSCIYCRRCSSVCPSGAITMSGRFESAGLERGDVIFVGTATGKLKRVEMGHETHEKLENLGHDIEEKVKKHFKRSLAIRQVSAGSCNACEVECVALTNPYYDTERLGIHFVASPRHADVLLVTGPPSRQMALALKKTYDATPTPKLVIAMGACAISGGIFRGSYAAEDGVASILPVDLYIPGCPPRPQALIYGLCKLLERLDCD